MHVPQGIRERCQETLTDAHAASAHPFLAPPRCRLLNAAAFDTLPTRPALVISAAPPSGISQVPKKQREEALIQEILATLRHGGTVLVPVDPTGRVLELLMLLQAKWKESK